MFFYLYAYDPQEAGKGWKSALVTRYQKLKEIEPKKYEYCFKSCSEGGLGFNDVMDYMGVNYK